MAAPFPVMMLPYRDVDNRQLRYTSAPAVNCQPPSPYDSDAEPLINRSAQTSTEVDEDALLRFTATGQPLPAFKYNGLQSLAGDMYSLPQLLPKRYTDDSLIPAIVVDVIPSTSPTSPKEKKSGRAKSLLSRIKTGLPEEKKSNGRLTKVVYMPRRDYLKWFARDKAGQYIGTEPKREWTEAQLDAAFKQWQPVLDKKKRRTGLI
ncbi:hypothetical protein B0O99DRAFT_688552 [Bisporella sp. PMI_857]|nr:hypothetical protein B0O99DRAFT_688552 [Bisporella sp. PMI_857]